MTDPARADTHFASDMAIDLCYVRSLFAAVQLHVEQLPSWQLYGSTEELGQIAAILTAAQVFTTSLIDRCDRQDSTGRMRNTD